MALPIGHRNGVKIRNKGGALGRIRRPHGIPFYSPAEVYQKRDYMEGENVNIVFRARGSLSNSTPQITGRLKGSTRMMFAPGAEPSSSFDFNVTQSYKLKGDTTIQFRQTANPQLYRAIYGVSWIIFNSRVLIHRLLGEASLQFESWGNLKGYNLRGNISIDFACLIEVLTATVIITEDSLSYITTEDGLSHITFENY